MTVLEHVSVREMEKQTGFKTALGYSFPKEDKILIRKGLPKDLEKEVKQHEEEHMAKGEEGPFLNFLIPAAISLFGAVKSSSAAKKATAAQVQAGEREIDFQRESRDLARGDQAPYREAGYTALDALMSMTGLGGGRRAQEAPQAAPQQIQATDYLSGLGGGVGRFSQFGGPRVASRAYGGHMYGRNYGGNMYGRNDGGDLYNVNELGPESVYQDGSYTRSDMPQTLPPSMGYVAPNIQGRALGGSLYGQESPPVGWGGPQRLTTGTTVDNNTGQPVGGFSSDTLRNQGAPENPGGVAGGYNFMTDPGYGFRIGEGQRALERGAAARGGLLSGGFGRRMTRYAQDYASKEYTNVYNRISNIAGLGQTSAGQSGQFAMQAGQGMGAAAAGIGNARASGYTARGNAWSNAADTLATNVPWEDIFKGSTQRRPGP